mgnify:CR=1 FL=1
MEMGVETQIRGGPLYRGDRADLRTHGALLRRSTDIKRLHRIHEDLCEPAEQFTVLGEPWSPREREGPHPLPARSLPSGHSAVQGGNTRSIRLAAVALIRRPMHDGQNPRPLQLKASSRVSPHARHFSRAKPRQRGPQSR